MKKVFLILFVTFLSISSSSGNCFCNSDQVPSCSIRNINLDYFKKAFSGSSIACFRTVNSKNVSSYFSSFAILEVENFSSDVFPKVILQKLRVYKLVIKNSEIKAIEEDALSIADTYRRNFFEIDLSFNNLQKVNLKSFFKQETGNKINVYVNMEFNKIIEIINFAYGTGKFNQTLNFANNQLKSVKIGNSVNNLNFSFNEICEILCPENFYDQVESLDLSNNLLKKSAGFYDCMQRMTNLKFLNLSFNDLGRENTDEPLRLQTFTELIKLEKLSLAGSGFTTIPYGLFSRLDKLNYLDLSYNKFEALDFKRLLPLTNLNILDLSYNNFQSLTNFIDIKVYLKSLNRLGLDGSDFYCERLASLIINLQRNGVNLMEPKYFVKNDTNIYGVRCDEE